MGMTEGTQTAGEGASLQLDDIQSGALHEQPSPYVGRYLLLRIDDRAGGRELVRRLHPFVDSGPPSADPARDAWITVAFTYHGLKALGVSQDSLDSFSPEFQQGMAARAAELGDVGESSPEHWEKPLGTADVHVALAVLSPDAARLEALAERARNAHEQLPGVEVIWRQDCYQLPTGRTSSASAAVRPSRPGSRGRSRRPTRRSGRSRPARSSSATRTRRANCRRCRRPSCSAATAPTSSSASCTRGSRPTGSTCTRRQRAGKRRRCWARRWSDAGRAGRPWRSPPSATIPSSAPTLSATTISSTVTICVGSSAPPARTLAAPTRGTRSTTKEASTCASTA